MTSAALIIALVSLSVSLLLAGIKVWETFLAKSRFFVDFQWFDDENSDVELRLRFTVANTGTRADSVRVLRLRAEDGEVSHPSGLDLPVLLQRAEVSPPFDVAVRTDVAWDPDTSMFVGRAHLDVINSAGRTSAFPIPNPYDSGVLGPHSPPPPASEETRHRPTEAAESTASVDTVSATPGVLFASGLRALERGSTNDAIRAFQQASNRGHAQATTALRDLLHASGLAEQAERSLRLDDEREDPNASYNLGVLLHSRGDLAGAEAAWRRADAMGDAGAASSLGVLFKAQGRLSEAEEAYRRADGRGHAGGAFNLGLLLMESGDGGGAEAAWRRADERGDPDAAFNLGVLLERAGDAGGAEAAYRRAEQAGVARASLGLASLLKSRGDQAGAREVLRRALDSSDESVAVQARRALEL